jgi:hypothetical protein
MTEILDTRIAGGGLVWLAPHLLGDELFEADLRKRFGLKQAQTGV